MPKDLSRLETQIGYAFSDKQLLDLALSHRSVGAKNNERLEYLGDAILSVVVAEELYHRFPKAKEGQLSRLRASLVKGITLAEIAREFDLGDYLNLGAGELKSGGFRRESILADGVESIIGAMFLDSDHACARQVVRQWYASRFDSLSLDSNEKDPKTRLQELMQSRKLPLPKYEVTKVEGEAHDQFFEVACQFEWIDRKASEVLNHRLDGQGSSRKIAEQNAAKAALDFLEAR